MSFDLSIVETGNGGDLLLAGNDLVIVRDIENMPYLAMFGGNKEQSSGTKVKGAQSFDWWGNNLLMLSNRSVQFNSISERILNTTPLTSSGRVLIENAIKKDLEFLTDMGSTVEVEATIVATDRIDILLRVALLEGGIKTIKIKLQQSTDGDFFFMDFNDDFYL